MANSVLSLFLLTIALVGVSHSANVLHTRDGLPIVGDLLGGLPVVGPLVGTVTGAVGGLLGLSVGATATNQQKADCMAAKCGQTACSAQSNTNNTANGSGQVAGVGSLVGPININAPICPAICLQCNQLGLLNLG